ncbi:tripartite tricarboxylate transporter TctB family protein [Salicibibacter cibarius]|uniref:Tripartite tricarboxylate transporter TctB family protein n=1 Tax=Salicibibacter cibarius TaxID=2743000 RepID=A0A7T6Z3T2_9BACI|nr:tripartite tricarboxylate transporter TctB family protein [Salicibibacter cibarius]QQK76267.1 tripartite tricarboxylate transporter TctB family protein [Salicibibacter cibarius]
MIKLKLSIVFSVILFFIFASVTWRSLDFSPTAMYFPLVVGVAGILLSAINILSQSRSFFRHKRQGTTPNDQENTNEYEIPMTHKFKVAAVNFLWVASFFLLIFLLGFKIAAASFITAFLKKRTDFNWLAIVLSVVLIIGLLITFEEVMTLQFPQGILI